LPSFDDAACLFGYPTSSSLISSSVFMLWDTHVRTHREGERRNVHQRRLWDVHLRMTSSRRGWLVRIFFFFLRLLASHFAHAHIFSIAIKWRLFQAMTDQIDTHKDIPTQTQCHWNHHDHCPDVMSRQD
jgi:hypothetical protein